MVNSALNLRTFRVVVFAILTALFVAELDHILHTWRLMASKYPVGAQHYSGFASAWTFFLPCSVGLLLGILASWLAAMNRGKYWPVVLVLTAALGVAYVYLVNRGMYFAYNPNHSGPGL